jgi:hypothetical protein
MATIVWCKKQKQGIRLVEPNDTLFLTYINAAYETIDAFAQTPSPMWKATMQYYTRYFAMYALLMKIGVKCEIHECTLTVYRLLQKERIISPEDYTALKEDKNLRIENKKNPPLGAIPALKDGVLRSSFLIGGFFNLKSRTKVRGIRPT